MSKVLVIDDEQNMRHLLSVLLEKEGYKVSLAADGQQGLAALKGTRFDVVLCDIRMPEMDGLELLEELKRQGIDIPVIMMSAFGTVELAVQAMKKGAYDFVTKPFQGVEVLISLKKAIEKRLLQQENKDLRQKLKEVTGDIGFEHIVGKSELLANVIRQASKIARYRTTILITGESGTGKELLAQGIHKASERSMRPFVAVNCGSIPENLMETELFGHVQGAFTGAEKDSYGLFDEAEGGTLFLDEIGELPLVMQVKLLRVLQENEFRPVGGSKVKNVDVRIVAATSRDLERDVSEGRFREDLFFRLNVLHLHIPPLRDRYEDIPLLINHFLRKVNLRNHTSVQGITQETRELLMQYQWPGNVRELENIIERAVLLSDNDVLLPADLPDHFASRRKNRRLDDLLGTNSIKKGQKILEHRLIARALEATGGNKSRAARILEISYPSLLSKIKEYAILEQNKT
jgi:two-component system response regulator AtoC